MTSLLRFSRAKALATLAALVLIVLSCSMLLPIPVRGQAATSSAAKPTPTLSASSAKGVQFPSTISACAACQPAFSSAPCQLILDSIGSGSSTPISNSTLADCQCQSAFLNLYSTCVKCFTETNQLNLVFGEGRAPAQSSLESYCKSAGATTGGAAAGGGNVGKSGKPSNSTSTTNAVSSTLPSSGTAEGRPLMMVGAVLVAVVVVCLTSVV